MAGTVVADTLQADSTSTLVIKNGVANTPPTIQDSAGTQIGTFCRAWVNFNGTSTVAIRASFNVTSITDNGTGNYTVNFTTAMPDANYAPVINGSMSGTNAGVFDMGSNAQSPSITTTALKVFSHNTSGTFIDAEYMNVAIFR